MSRTDFQELASLFFTTRQIIRERLPSGGGSDPNSWLHFETLRFIGETGDPTMHDVARYLRVKAPSATSLIARLAQAGFVVRKGEPGDKRIVRISLTPRGKKEVTAYMNRCGATIRAVFSRLDGREVSELAAALRHLRDVHQP